MGAPPLIVNAVMSMLADSSVRVRVGDSLSEPFHTVRGTKQGDPISPTLFALIAEPLARSIINDGRIQGLPIDTTTAKPPVSLSMLPPPAFGTKQRKPPPLVHLNWVKLLQFADDTSTFAKNIREFKLMDEWIQLFCKATSSKVNTDKCVIMSPGSPTNLPYPLMDKESKERYLGYYFNQFGLVPHLPERIDKVINDLIRWKPKHNNNYRGKLALLKTYGLSQLNYFTYLESPSHEAITRLEKVIDWFMFSNDRQYDPTKPTKRTMSKKRSIRSIDQGGLNLWDLNARFRAQKAWMFERFLHEVKNDRVAKVSFAQSWMDQLNQDKPNDFVRLCRSEWEKLTQPYDVSREAVPKPAMEPDKRGRVPLKQVNLQRLTIANEKWNVYDPTPGQKILATDDRVYPMNALAALSTIVLPKGRDLVWKYVTKCLPLVRGDPVASICVSCGKDESSKHLFFQCKETTLPVKLLKEVTAANNITPPVWDITLLNLKQTPMTINLVAATLERIWFRRNDLRHQRDEPFTEQYLRARLISDMRHIIKIYEYIDSNNDFRLDYDETIKKYFL
ncbi:Pol [Cavenderia fasciculata]|uniref:Pol n=1 Tax=Cavenderia fasciculata TaxID=261658 RepID=F4Q6B3_CACFS|nr:Pol [Cavenderia fasciculata]EGG16423.1 Pol [Cavenderia fasciculata]|eukprot:XP_004354823.1 Pol [Cavenderia fasciculata]